MIKSSLKILSIVLLVCIAIIMHSENAHAYTTVSLCQTDLCLKTNLNLPSYGVTFAQFSSLYTCAQSISVSNGIYTIKFTRSPTCFLQADKVRIGFTILEQRNIEQELLQVLTPNYLLLKASNNNQVYRCTLLSVNAQGAPVMNCQTT